MQAATSLTVEGSSAAPAQSRGPARRAAPADTALLHADPFSSLGARRLLAVAVAIVLLASVAIAVQFRAIEREQSQLDSVRAQRSELDDGLGAQVRRATEEAAALETDMTRMRLQWDPALITLRRGMQQDALDVACNSGRDGEDLDTALDRYAAQRPDAAELAALPGWQRTLNTASLRATWDRCRGLR